MRKRWGMLWGPYRSYILLYPLWCVCLSHPCLFRPVWRLGTACINNKLFTLFSSIGRATASDHYHVLYHGVSWTNVKRKYKYINKRLESDFIFDESITKLQVQSAHRNENMVETPKRPPTENIIRLQNSQTFTTRSYDTPNTMFDSQPHIICLVWLTGVKSSIIWFSTTWHSRNTVTKHTPRAKMTTSFHACCCCSLNIEPTQPKYVALWWSQAMRRSSSSSTGTSDLSSTLWEVRHTLCSSVKTCSSIYLLPATNSDQDLIGLRWSFVPPDHKSAHRFDFTKKMALAGFSKHIIRVTFQTRRRIHVRSIFICFWIHGSQVC